MVAEASVGNSSVFCNYSDIWRFAISEDLAADTAEKQRKLQIRAVGLNSYIVTGYIVFGACYSDIHVV